MIDEEGNKIVTYDDCGFVVDEEGRKQEQWLSEVRCNDWESLSEANDGVVRYDSVEKVF